MRFGGLWFGVWGLGFRVQGLGFRGSGFGFRVSGLDFKVLRLDPGVDVVVALFVHDQVEVASLAFLDLIVDCQKFEQVTRPP